MIPERLVFEEGKYTKCKLDVDININADFETELKTLGFNTNPSITLGDTNSNFYIDVYEFDWMKHGGIAEPSCQFRYYISQAVGNLCHTILIKDLPDLNAYLSMMAPVITASLLTDKLTGEV